MTTRGRLSYVKEMADSEADGWTVLDEDAALLTRVYRFGPNAFARTMVARFKDGELVVMSPPCSPDDAALKALEPFGKVTALVAPNGFHHLGLPEWAKAFPDAKLYAPDKALARVRKKQPDLSPLRPLAELGRESTSGVELLDLPFFSIGEAWLKAPSRDGQVWYVSDSCFNLASLPPALVVRLLFKWTKSAPGFRINRLGNLIFLKDRAGYKSWFAEQLRDEEPAIVVPAHGDVVKAPDLRTTLNSMIEEAI